MTTKAIWLRHAAELWTANGPTGTFVDVTWGQVRDHGGNVLFDGPADECVAQRYRISVRLVPTLWVPVYGDVCGADHTWQLVYGSPAGGRTEGVEEKYA